jgi:hypothetical protein
MRNFILLGLLCLHPLTMAADNAPQDQVGDDEAAELEVTPEVAEPEEGQASEELEDFILADVEATTDEEEESSRRFIPTEQISQDLGVSFPVDI